MVWKLSVIAAIVVVLGSALWIGGKRDVEREGHREQYLLRDRFDRADGPLGIAETGQAYTVSGAGTASIAGGRAVTNGTAYIVATLPSQPRRFGGKISFVAGKGTTAGYQSALIISSGPNPLYVARQRMLHLSFNRGSCSMTRWNTTSGRQGVGWDAPLASGTSNVTFSKPVPLDGTPMDIEVTVSGVRVRAVFSVRHVTIGVMEAADPLLPSLVGNMVVWELTATPATAAEVPRWDEFVAAR